MFAFARVHMRPISPIRHDRTGPKRKGPQSGAGGGGGGGSIYPRGCENASLIKSILGNRRCMNDGGLVRGCVGSGDEKIRAYRGYNGAIRRGTSSVFQGDVHRYSGRGGGFAYGTNRAIIPLAINARNIRPLPITSVIGQRVFRKRYEKRQSLDTRAHIHML